MHFSENESIMYGFHVLLSDIFESLGLGLGILFNMFYIRS